MPRRNNLLTHVSSLLCIGRFSCNVIHAYCARDMLRDGGGPLLDMPVRVLPEPLRRLPTAVIPTLPVGSYACVPSCEAMPNILSLLAVRLRTVPHLAPKP